MNDKHPLIESILPDAELTFQVSPCILQQQKNNRGFAESIPALRELLLLRPNSGL